MMNPPFNLDYEGALFHIDQITIVHSLVTTVKKRGKCKKKVFFLLNWH